MPRQENTAGISYHAVYNLSGNPISGKNMVQTICTELPEFGATFVRKENISKEGGMLTI